MTLIGHTKHADAAGVVIVKNKERMAVRHIKWTFQEWLTNSAETKIRSSYLGIMRPCSFHFLFASLPSLEVTTSALRMKTNVMFTERPMPMPKGQEP